MAITGLMPDEDQVSNTLSSEEREEILSLLDPEVVEELLKI